MAAFKKIIAESDGVLIATPEYNHGVPGVLKNALDWASRPVFESCFRHKPVSIISSSLAFTGGVRAQYQLRETLISMQAHLVMGPEVVVGGVHTKWLTTLYRRERACIHAQVSRQTAGGNTYAASCRSLAGLS